MVKPWEDDDIDSSEGPRPDGIREDPPAWSKPENGPQSPELSERQLISGGKIAGGGESPTIRPGTDVALSLSNCLRISEQRGSWLQTPLSREREKGRRSRQGSVPPTRTSGHRERQTHTHRIPPVFKGRSRGWAASTQTSQLALISRGRNSALAASNTLASAPLLPGGHSTDISAQEPEAASTIGLWEGGSEPRALSLHPMPARLTHTPRSSLQLCSRPCLQPLSSSPGKRCHLVRHPPRLRLQKASALVYIWETPTPKFPCPSRDWCSAQGN
nr:uncharacterized protein LOC112544780 [Pelodiscus sinensis]|eukprot:XP_025037391.1 uncharacterized protein LOC112544780 [Pelodiscus sinensis]